MTEDFIDLNINVDLSYIGLVIDLVPRYISALFYTDTKIASVYIGIDRKSESKEDLVIHITSKGEFNTSIYLDSYNELIGYMRGYMSYREDVNELLRPPPADPPEPSELDKVIEEYKKEKENDNGRTC